MADTIGLIAGNGIYPETFARAARSAGVPRLVAGAFLNETDPTLENHVDSLAWLRVGQLGKLIKFFKKEGVTRAVMVGQIAPANLFDVRPDMRTLVMLGKLKQRNAETIFGAIADEFSAEGIELIPATTYLDDLLPPPGHVCGPPADKKRLADARYGFHIAKQVSQLDIGQTVVVKKGTVLAVEAFEGTNEAIARGGKLGRGGATAAKVSKPGQDLRFDVPVVGPATIQAAAAAGVKTVAVEAHRTLLLGLPETTAICENEKITLHALDDAGTQEPTPTHA